MLGRYPAPSSTLSCSAAGTGAFKLAPPPPPADAVPAKNNRRALRDRFNLDAQPCGDGWAHCLLGPCAMCQEARELKVRWPAALSCCAALHRLLERCCAVLFC